ncbi:MAG: HAD-IB family phosphatase [Candidatus Thermoplasmatota archaeon]|jgi:phosphoserine phosphatase|nr:HAD-IB family phosphatase [Candidatus Thermoplasmatota archaeon]MCL5930697.1 HAD-IB family phosphatase [Candidatus Thermoplasmatota archaeon]
MIPSLIAFDVDGVLLQPKSSWNTIHDYFGVKNEESLRAFLKGEIGYQEFIDRDVNLWLGKQGKITRGDFRRIAKNIMPNPNFECLRDFLKEFNGNKIAISGGIDVIVSKVKEYFDLDEIYSNKLVFHDDTLIGGSAVVNPHEKGLFLEKYRGHKVSIGDSEWDKDMFKNSDYSILFNSDYDLEFVDCIIHSNDLKELTNVLRDLK